MKRALTLITIAACFAAVSCIDTEKFTTDITDLQRRVSALEERCDQMNTNLASMKTILDAINQDLFIVSYDAVRDPAGKETGSVITFSDGSKITIYHGKDGKDGTDGQNGHTPQMGVSQYTDGVWYWTVDGQWLLVNGGKVRASGRDGQNGADGITPQLRITKGNWEVSTDGGVTWTDMGKATGQDGQDGDSFFKAVTYDEDDVTFTLSDGTTVLTIPRSAKLQIAFDPADGIDLTKGVKKVISYSVTSPKTPVTVTLSTSSDIRAKVTPSAADGLAGTITLEATAEIDEYSRVVVIADNGSRTTAIPLALRSTNGHEYVDLGLSVKWATMNVGASKPEDYGDYFAWGEISPKYSSRYEWSTYKWCNGSSHTLTKYNTYSSYGSVVDRKRTLDLEDDAAAVNWGGTWRMPTRAEFNELENNCTSTWAQEGGVNGRKFTGPNGNSIFLPAAGFRDGTSIDDTGSYGYYWSSSLTTVGPSYAFFLNFDSGAADADDYYSRYFGYSVRPVTE